MPVAALRALLEHAIDYAGLFPPADLALEQALENHAAYVRSADRWMLGVFYSAGREIRRRRGSARAIFRRIIRCRFPRSGRRVLSPLNFARRCEDLVAEIERFQSAHAGVLAVTQLEMPLPPGAEPESLGELRVFWEAPAGAAPATIAALAGTGAGLQAANGRCDGGRFSDRCGDRAGSHCRRAAARAAKVHRRAASSGEAFSRKRRRKDAWVSQRPRCRRARGGAWLGRSAGGEDARR